jgi:VWFA-related protein
VNTEIVNLNVSVTDRDGRNVTGLTRQDFVVLDNGEPGDVTFFSDGDEPISIGIIFDLSDSMKGKKIAFARESLDKLIGTSHPMDEYFLIAFNERSQLLLDHSFHGAEVVKKLTEAQPTGDTSLFDAVYLGMINTSPSTTKDQKWVWASLAIRLTATIAHSTEQWALCANPR